jgi:FG-GAP-like repeat/FG-GAP repeat
MRTPALTTALTLSLCFAALTQQASGQFFPAVNYPVENNPFSIAVGDFNGDGIHDLAVANANQTGTANGSISILIGNGDGTFKAAVSYDSGGNEPSSVVTADFNGDGKLDLVVANFGGGGGVPNLVLFLGNGDGTFSKPVAIVTETFPNLPLYIAVADFNGDGKPDLAVTTTVNVTIFLGKGDGTFNTPVNYPDDAAPSAIAISDFNHDGNLDLAVSNENENGNNVSILLGNGNGTFQAAVNYPAGFGPASIAVGDFNGDGNPDLVVANASSADNGAGGTTISVLLGNGNGTFQAPVSYLSGSEPIGVAVGDFNSDGKLDIVAANFGAGNGTTISLLLGNGDGTFQAAVEYDVGMGPVFVAAADLTHKGLLDLVVANDDGGTISVLLNSNPAPCTIRPDIDDLSADPDHIWPPNYRFVKVHVKYKATSRCGGPPVCTLSVTSNQRDDRTDWIILNAHYVDLRAAESGPKCTDPHYHHDDLIPEKSCSWHEEHDKRRIYTIAVKCTDTNGNSATEDTTVTVSPNRNDKPGPWRTK